MTGNLTRAATYSALAGLGLLLAAPWDATAILERWNARLGAPWTAWPWPAQLPLALLWADLVGYASHGARHAWWWSFHAVHHSPVCLDYLSAARMHPLDDLVDNVAVGLALLLGGFAPAIWWGLGPFLLLFNMYLHANVRVNLGPLRYVFATPAFHRWHHQADAVRAPRNLAGLFPFIDVAFGTFYLSAGRAPQGFGAGHDVGETMGQQLMHPFVSPAERS